MLQIYGHFLSDIVLGDKYFVFYLSVGPWEDYQINRWLWRQALVTTESIFSGDSLQSLEAFLAAVNWST